ncbi:CENPT protein, partial [Amia calva]|nr:CENPT protein [Amia calva]
MEQDGEDLEIQQSGTEDNLSELSGGAASSFSLTLKTPHMDLDSGKPGLQRKAVKRKAICVEDFEEGVQNYLHNKRSPGLEKSTSNPHKTLSETGALETFTLGFSALTVPDMTDNLMSNTKLYDHTSFILQTPHYAASLPLGPREDSGTNQTLDGMGPEEEEGPVAERKVEGSWLHPQTEVEGEEEKAEQDLEETGVETLEGSQQVGEEGDREEAGLEEEEEGEEEGEEVAAESQRRMGEVEGESRGLTDQEKEGSGIVVNEGDLDEMPQEMEVAGEAEEEEEEQQQAEHIARRATRSQGGLKLKSPDSLQGGKGDGSVIVDGELADETTRNSPTPLGSPRGASLDEGPPSSSPQPNRSRRTLSGADSEQGGGSGVLGESESESDLHAGEEWDKENSAPVPKLEASAPPGTPIPHSTTAVELGLSGQDEEEQLSSSDEEEDGSQSEELSMKTPAFLRAKKMPETPGALPTPTFLKNKPTRQLALTAATTKPPRKPRAASAKKEPGLPKSYIMSVFTHFAKTKVSRDIYPVLKETLDKYFDRLSDDLEAYAKHAKRKTIEKEDVELLLRRQGFVTERTPLNVLIERYLPLQYRQLLIPVATSGNKVIPKM